MMVQSALTIEEKREGKEYSKINVLLLQLLRLDSISLDNTMDPSKMTQQQHKTSKMAKRKVIFLINFSSVVLLTNNSLSYYFYMYELIYYYFNVSYLTF